MPYSLHVPRVMEVIWDGLPHAASEALTLAMADVCEDPIMATVPYGEDDGVMRNLVLPTVMAIVLVDAPAKRVVLVQINHFDW